MKLINYKSLAFLLFLLNFCSSGEGNGKYDAKTDPDVVTGDEGGFCHTQENYCSFDRTKVLKCDPATGQESTIEECNSGYLCVNGECIQPVCNPRSAQCLSQDISRVCREDGSGWDEIQCGELQSCEPETGLCEIPCLLRIFILLDRSGSMADLTPSKWEQAREALREVVSSPAASDIEFGLGAFPTDGNCGVDGLVVYPVPIPSVDMIDTFFTTYRPNGNTPLLDAMKKMLVETSANIYDPAYYNFLLVVSDGADTCFSEHCLADCGPFNIQCITECEQRAEQQLLIELADTTDALLRDMRIRTFVIGFGSEVADAELDTIAQHGGTELGRWLDAANVTELTQALQQIIDEMRECNPVPI